MLTFEQVVASIRNQKFYLIVHWVVLHHLRKDFDESDIIRDRFYILPVGNDYLHVAIVETDTGREQSEVQVRYTCAGDDLLYGMKVKFKSGGSPDPQSDLNDIERLIASGNLRGHPRYIRKRFRHGRYQAKIRAFLIFLRDQWREMFVK